MREEEEDELLPHQSQHNDTPKLLFVFAVVISIVCQIKNEEIWILRLQSEIKIGSLHILLLRLCTVSDLPHRNPTGSCLKVYESQSNVIHFKIVSLVTSALDSPPLHFPL